MLTTPKDAGAGNVVARLSTTCTLFNVCPPRFFTIIVNVTLNVPLGCTAIEADFATPIPMLGSLQSGCAGFPACTFG